MKLYGLPLQLSWVQKILSNSFNELTVYVGFISGSIPRWLTNTWSMPAFIAPTISTSILSPIIMLSPAFASLFSKANSKIFVWFKLIRGDHFFKKDLNPEYISYYVVFFKPVCDEMQNVALVG